MPLPSHPTLRGAVKWYWECVDSSDVGKPEIYGIDTNDSSFRLFLHGTSSHPTHRGAKSILSLHCSFPGCKSYMYENCFCSSSLPNPAPRDAYSHNVLFRVVSHVCTKFGWNFSRPSKVLGYFYLSSLTTPSPGDASGVLPQSVLFWVVSHMYTRFGRNFSRRSRVFELFLLPSLPTSSPRGVLPSECSFPGWSRCPGFESHIRRGVFSNEELFHGMY